MQLLSMKNVRVFASSSAKGSSPAYAIDAEVSMDEPSCFHSQEDDFDIDTFAWLVLDLGIVTSNITDIYLVFDPNVKGIPLDVLFLISSWLNKRRGNFSRFFRKEIYKIFLT